MFANIVRSKILKDSTFVFRNNNVQLSYKILVLDIKNYVFILKKYPL